MGHCQLFENNARTLEHNADKLHEENIPVAIRQRILSINTSGLILKLSSIILIGKIISVH